jgi:hypothetical protein
MARKDTWPPKRCAGSEWVKKHENECINEEICGCPIRLGTTNTMECFGHMPTAQCFCHSLWQPEAMPGEQS